MAIKRIKLSSDLQKLKCSAIVSKIDRLLQQNHQLRLDEAKIKKLMDSVKGLRTCCSLTRNSKVYYRKVLYFVLERMFWSRFNDSQYVALLLNCIFEIEGHLYCLIVQNTEMCPSLNFVGVHEFSEYFIHHAYQGKVLFGGYRLLNSEMYDSKKWHTPVEMAASRPDPALLKQMLQYGALLSSEYKRHSDTNVRNFRHAGSSLTAVINSLSSIVKLNPNILSLEDLELEQEDLCRYKNYTRCCALLLKDCPFWPVNFLHAVEGLGRRKRSILDFIEIFSINVITDFKKHFIVPMDLKQACRLSIRRILNDKWLLPHGISNLKIPEILKLYLNT